MIDAQMRPTLAAKARLKKDAKSGRYLLLYPERGMELNATGVEIVKLCDGQTTVGEIIQALARRYATTPSHVVESEVLSFLGALEERALLQRAVASSEGVARDGHP
ncbi:MAG TPA: pyrroloquinoline quinone biosynthesis peptide chaperone PqqD [Polyangiaceae bacterium]|nr:pyrroloquinoline quinone biosynthesis peptide chaperone PqqD [Polyangiaceae bacterium]